ncbi:CBS domain-containing protein [Streptomyces mirabilis]|uniref:CBS domain-containing protein n=1 Tax=Streptomyces mirabilis TaxID=68239 RepID=UPI00382EA4D1
MPTSTQCSPGRTGSRRSTPASGSSRATPTTRIYADCADPVPTVRRRPAVEPTMIGAVMPDGVVTAQYGTPFEDVVRLLREHRISGLPVIDEEDRLYRFDGRHAGPPARPCTAWPTTGCTSCKEPAGLTVLRRSRRTARDGSGALGADRLLVTVGLWVGRPSKVGGTACRPELVAPWWTGAPALLAGPVLRTCGRRRGGLCPAEGSAHGHSRPRTRCP